MDSFSEANKNLALSSRQTAELDQDSGNDPAENQGASLCCWCTLTESVRLVRICAVPRDQLQREDLKQDFNSTKAI